MTLVRRENCFDTAASGDWGWAQPLAAAYDR